MEKEKCKLNDIKEVCKLDVCCIKCKDKVKCPSINDRCYHDEEHYKMLVIKGYPKNCRLYKKR